MITVLLAAVSGHRFNRLVNISAMVQCDTCSAVRLSGPTVIATHPTFRVLTLTLIKQQQQPYLPHGSHLDTASEMNSSEVRRFRSVMRLLSLFAKPPIF